jgi:hypothetical protein
LLFLAVVREAREEREAREAREARGKGSSAKARVIQNQHRPLLVTLVVKLKRHRLLQAHATGEAFVFVIFVFTFAA